MFEIYSSEFSRRYLALPTSTLDRCRSAQRWKGCRTQVKFGSGFLAFFFHLFPLRVGVLMARARYIKSARCRSRWRAISNGSNSPCPPTPTPHTPSAHLPQFCPPPCSLLFTRLGWSRVAGPRSINFSRNCDSSINISYDAPKIIDDAQNTRGWQPTCQGRGDTARTMELLYAT